MPLPNIRKKQMKISLNTTINILTLFVVIFHAGIAWQKINDLEKRFDRIESRMLLNAKKVDKKVEQSTGKIIRFQYEKFSERLAKVSVDEVFAF